MPTYEYECPTCGCRFERFEPITAKPKAKCPECGAKCRRLIGAGAGIIFKGPGFYATDYRDASYKKAAEKEGRSEGEAGGGNSKGEEKD
ncbi:MAG: zinc ribbon domain-containing protein [candidate division Zixibacteria bacterium]|nr:zinc ribbon domain-containing protein [candidate division Zixibacteria bacterium]